MAKKLLSWIVVLAALAAIASLAWTNRYNIYDWNALRNYTPSAEIAALATNSGMNDSATRVFYVQDPQLSDKDSFNKECSQFEESIVLGCFTGQNIYIYNVDNAELAGIKEVTAAHEMLHAAYERLDSGERQKVDAMVAAMYKNMSDSRISSLVKNYQDQNPAVVPNELHSIIGTEVRNLSPELEQYYSQYFDDRDKVVDLSEAYEQVFNDAKNHTEKLGAEIALRKVEINSLKQDLQAERTSLDQNKSQMDYLLASDNIAAYNAMVPSYERQRLAYNRNVNELQGLIEEHNQLVEEYNKTTVYQQKLVDSINSNIEPAQ